jgi:hypothetical protein
MTEETKSNLTKKMCAVMSQIETLPKNGWNSYHNYAYASDEDVLNLMRGLLANVGLVLFTKPIDIEFRPNNIVMLSLEITIVDSETCERETFPWFATAMDKQDKGIYKAVTTGLKYFLLKQFLVSTGDSESDADHGAKTTKKDEGKTDSNLATEKQTKAVWAMLTKLGAKNVDDALKARDLPALDKLTKGQASDVIKRLQEAIDKQKDGSS